MRLIERRVRQFFAFQAIVPILGLILSIVHPMRIPPGASPARLYGVTASYMILALIYGRAWLATRAPREFRSPWPIAASLVSVAVGSCSFWFARPSLSYEAPGIITTVVGFAGFLIYTRGKSSRLGVTPPRRQGSASTVV
ncbi:MAG TPA: hypothetical protein VGN01_10905 [Acidobacteriaceae bacterium]